MDSTSSQTQAQVEAQELARANDNTRIDTYLDFLDQIELSEDVESRLEVLVKIAEMLGVEDVGVSGYANAIINLSERRLSIKESIHRASFAREELSRHIAEVRHEIGLIRKWKNHFDSDSSSSEDSIESLQEKRRVLVKKAKEYRAEIDSISSSSSPHPPVTITQLLEQQSKNALIEERIKRKRLEVKTYRGVPSNLEDAKKELLKKREEVGRLEGIREKLLNGMVRDVS